MQKFYEIFALVLFKRIFCFEEIGAYLSIKGRTNITVIKVVLYVLLQFMLSRIVSVQVIMLRVIHKKCVGA